MTNRRRLNSPYPGPGPLPGQAIGGGPGGVWELPLVGDLGDKQSDLLGRLVEVPRGSRGTIYFDTGGGSVYSGLALASIICLRGLEVDGIVAGECSSAALLPFAACKRRYVTAHSTLLFHPIRWQSEEDVRFEEAVEWARHFEVLEKDIDKLLVRMLGIDEAKLQEWTRPGRFVMGQELVDAGLAHLLDLFGGDFQEQKKRFANE